MKGDKRRSNTGEKTDSSDYQVIYEYWGDIALWLLVMKTGGQSLWKNVFLFIDRYKVVMVLEFLFKKS